jgi:hypothetical protein
MVYCKNKLEELQHFIIDSFNLFSLNLELVSSARKSFYVF